MIRVVLAQAALIAALATSAPAQTPESFQRIAVSGPYQVVITRAPTSSYAITGRDADRLRATISDHGTLRIEPRQSRRSDRGDYEAVVTISLPTLTSLEASSGTSVQASLAGPCNALDLESAMGAEVTVTGLQCQTVDSEASMGGALTIEGTCRQLNAQASMGGMLAADNLRCERVTAGASMGAMIEAFASSTYTQSSWMGADVDVRGGGTRSR
jgi:hypothetical protein